MRLQEYGQTPQKRKAYVHQPALLLVTACPLLAAILIRWAIPPTLGINEVRNAVA